MARPIRGEVLALREKEFVEAAIAQGAGPLRVMFAELLPNLWSTIIVFFTLNIANNMLLEAALSFLGAGVQPPSSSWGTMIADGFDSLYSAPLLTIIPGTMILLTRALAERLRRRAARRARPEIEGPPRGARRQGRARGDGRSDGPLRRSAGCSAWCWCCSRSR